MKRLSHSNFLFNCLFKALNKPLFEKINKCGEHIYQLTHSQRWVSCHQKQAKHFAKTVLMPVVWQGICRNICICCHKRNCLHFGKTEIRRKFCSFSCAFWRRWLGLYKFFCKRKLKLNIKQLNFKAHALLDVWPSFHL